ncbi:hypothetical protein EG338_08805 [Kaistella haifensis]|nr:hypothetical protein EG338_08805 [Kaistella haifensis]
MTTAIKVNVLKERLSESQKNQKFKRDHIFYDLKEIIKKDINHEGVIDCYYCFFLYEKIIRLSREKSFQLSEYYSKKTLETHAKIGKENVQYLNILFYPAIAYMFYAKKKFENAENYINKEIVVVNKLLKENKILLLELKMEQSINLFRIYFENQQFNKALGIAKGIFDFIFFNKQNHILDDVSAMRDFHKESGNKNIWIEYVTNIIASKFVFSKLINDKQKLDFLNEIFLPLNNFDYDYLSIYKNL